ncbi:hypothetical protein [Allorhizobium ampelinum]|uniref:hypothetical protein n=1 Tax=Allorhizobium ampelinum TaxID=3025782 RepID=UPI001F2378CE|nr:hypothetical protein [Allorhizobium ampelinum]
MHLIAQIGHLTIETPNLNGMVHEAENLLGLRITAQDDRRVSLTSNSRRAELTFVEAAVPAVRSIGFEAISGMPLTKRSGVFLTLASKSWLWNPMPREPRMALCFVVQAATHSKSTPPFRAINRATI